MLSDIATYRRPYPTMTDQAAIDGPCCPATRSAWLCTRPRDHEGRHEAGGPGGHMFASWWVEGGEPS